MGAIFGVPIAAVISAFFFHFYRRSRESGTRHGSGGPAAGGAGGPGDPPPARAGGRGSTRTSARPTSCRAAVHAPDAAAGGADRPGPIRAPAPRLEGEARRTTRRRRLERAGGDRRAGRAQDAASCPDMTRERARTERRDLDKERGEPLAGGAARGGPRALRRMARPLGDWTTRPKILVTNDDGIESRGHPRAEAGARPTGRRDGRRAGHEPVRGRPPEDADAPAARPRADPRRRLHRLVRGRLADRRGQPRVPRLLRPRLRPRRLGHQLRREPRRRHHLLRARSRRRWRR